MDFILTFTAFLLQYILRLFAIGRLNRKNIVFFSYFGSQYSCNPKYISDYFESNYPEYKRIWAFNNPEEFSGLQEKGISVIRMNSLAFIRACLTSRFVVTNSELPSWLPVTKRQILINTWHGGGAYKRVGADFHKATIWRDLRSAIGRSKPCVYLSSSDAFTKMTIRESFGHKGEIIESGMPRNDMLVRCRSKRDSEFEKTIRNRLGIPTNNHILLYAPTYREDRRATSYAFDFRRVTNVLKERFGGDWTILLRTHYLVAQELPRIDYCIDVSEYGDMQELLYVSDVLITDYSSSMWDFGLTGRPCFLYATDLDFYDVDRGFYTDIHTWPWPLCENNDQLIESIALFDEEEFGHRLEEHYISLGSKESGCACEIVSSYMVAHT